MDSHWPCDCTAQSSILSISSASLVSGHGDVITVFTCHDQGVFSEQGNLCHNSVFIDHDQGVFSRHGNVIILSSLVLIRMTVVRTVMPSFCLH